MLLAIKELDKIEKFLDTLVENKKIHMYRIYINLDTTISIDIVANESDNLKNEIENFSNINIYVDEWISIEDYESDEYYKTLFKEKINKNHRRRLTTLVTNSKEHLNCNIPIITFYSYKGGVGRTTSLITFANYYAYHKNKKVVILETDKLLVNDSSKDTPIPITLKAYAKENPEKVVVYRKATFIYPRLDKLQ